MENVQATISINSGELISGLKNAIKFVSGDEFRPAMQGVLFELRGGKINIVSTDSYRLYQKTIELIGQTIDEDLTLQVVLKADDIKAYLKSKPLDYTLSMDFMDDENGKLALGYNGKVIWHGIDGKFPNYESVVPDFDRAQYGLAMNLSDITGVCKAWPHLQKGYGTSIALVIDSKGEGDNVEYFVRPSDKDGDDYVFTLPLGLDVVISWDQARRNTETTFEAVGLNPKYVLDALSCGVFKYQKVPTLLYFGNMKPVILPLLQDNSEFCLIMPVRLAY